MHNVILFIALAFSAVSYAYAGGLSPSKKLDVLTCNVKASDKALRDVFLEAEAKGLKTGDGEVTLRGEHRFGGLCLRDVKLAAAFGVFGASGSLCSKDATPLIKHIRQTELGAFERSISDVPGLLAAFEANDKSLMISRGVVGMPDPGSTAISYLCSVKLGDHR